VKVIFSNIYNREAPDYEGWPELAAFSNFLIQKHGFETIFFGDEASLKIYKNIKYNHIEKINQKDFNFFPKCLWSIGKLVSLYKIREPAIHIDFDLLFFKKPCISKLENDIVCLHSEFFIEYFMKILQDLFIIKPKQCLNFPTISYNCGIVGGKDYKIIHKSLDILFQYIIENHNYIDVINNKYKNTIIDPNYDLFCPAALIEQVWFFQIIQSFNKKISPLFTEITDWHETYPAVSNKEGFLHLMRDKFMYKDLINNIVYKNNIKY
jgi:hypothetical protein